MTSHSLLFRPRVAGSVRDIRGKNPQEDRAPGGRAVVAIRDHRIGHRALETIVPERAGQIAGIESMIAASRAACPAGRALACSSWSWARRRADCARRRDAGKRNVACKMGLNEPDRSSDGTHGRRPGEIRWLYSALRQGHLIGIAVLRLRLSRMDHRHLGLASVPSNTTRATASRLGAWPHSLGRWAE